MTRLVEMALPIGKVVVQTDEHHAKCIVCEEAGWTKEPVRYGYPWGSKLGTRQNLRHKAGCPVNDHLHNDGSLKPLSDGSPVYCVGDKHGPCNEPVAWVRHTQFSGDHPLCDKHAREDTDFGNEDAACYFSSFPEVEAAGEAPTEQMA